MIQTLIISTKRYEDYIGCINEMSLILDCNFASELNLEICKFRRVLSHTVVPIVDIKYQIVRYVGSFLVEIERIQ